MTNQQKTYLGMTLFGIGALIAITSGAKIPADGSAYPDSVPVFILAAIICAIGNILWHKSSKNHAKEQIANRSRDALDPKDILANALKHCQELSSKIEGLNKDQICNEVDMIIIDNIEPFVEEKSHLINVYGMEQACDVLMHIAYAERMLNRTWSAASDGHLPEAKKSFPVAVKTIEHTLPMLS